MKRRRSPIFISDFNGSHGKLKRRDVKTEGALQYQSLSVFQVVRHIMYDYSTAIRRLG